MSPSPRFASTLQLDSAAEVPTAAMPAPMAVNASGSNLKGAGMGRRRKRRPMVAKTPPNAAVAPPMTRAPALGPLSLSRSSEVTVTSIRVQGGESNQRMGGG